MIFNMVGGGAGGAGGGATLVVSSPANVSVTVSKDDKSYTKSSGSLGSATFKGLATGTWTVVISNDGQTATKTIEITADYAITLAFFSATINITYPANSTCVVTNSGGQTVASDTNTTSSEKTWTATVGATGTYTVTATATDGSEKSKSRSVSITADGQSVNVTLSYALILFDGGAVVPWTARAASPTASIGTTLYVVAQNSSINVKSEITTTDKIDVSEYSTLNFNVSYGGGSRAYVGISSSTNNISPVGDTPSSAVAYAHTPSTGVYTIDISEVTGAYYAFMGIGGFGKSDMRINKVWLE